MGRALASVRVIRGSSNVFATQRRNRALLASVLAVPVIAALSCSTARAANLYWDANGTATGGSDTDTAAGTWGTSAFWSTDPTGAAETTSWTPGETAVFSAGTNVTGAYNVTIQGGSTQSAAGITVEEGVVRFAQASSSAVALGAGTVTINSGATLQVNGISTITQTAGGGGVVINGGTLENVNPGNAGSFWTANGNITLGAGGGTLKFDTLNILNILGNTSGGNATVINGTGSLTKTGQGVLAIVSASKYTGPTFINQGELRVRTNNNVLPTATALTVTGPGILNLNGLSQQIGSLSGDGTVGTGGGTLTINGSASTTFTGSIKNIANAGAGGVTTGNGKLTKAGSGTITFTGQNDINGNVTLSAGGIVVASGASLCGPICDIIVNGGTLTMNNAAQTIENLTGTGGTIVLSPGHVLTMNAVANGTYSGVLSGAGNLVVNAGFVETLAGNNTPWTGKQTVQNGGTLAGTTDAAFGAVPATAVPDQITLDNGSVGLSSTPFTLNANRGITLLGGGGKFNTAAGVYTYAGVVTGNGELGKTGVGTIALSGANNYTGNTNIDGGAIRFDNPAAIAGSGANVNANNGGIAAAGYAIDQAFLSRINTGSGGVVALAVDSANNLDLSSHGNIRLGAIANSTLSGTITPSNSTYRFGGGGSTLTVASALTGDNSVNMGNNGAATGTVILSATNTYTGSTSVEAGVLAFASPVAIGGSGASVQVNEGGAAAFLYAADQAALSRINTGSGGVFALGTDTANDLNFSGFGSLHLGAIGNYTFSGTLTPDGDTYRLGGGGGVLTIASALVGDGKRVEVNNNNAVAAGTVVLAGANTFTNGTDVYAGKLGITSDVSLGAVPSSPNESVKLHPGTALLGLATIALDANRQIALNDAGAGSVYTLDVATGTSLTIPGEIKNGADSAVLAKAGAGTLVLSGNNSFNGNLTSNVGSTVITNASAVGNGTKTITVSGGQFHLDGAGGDINLPSDKSVTSSGVTIFNDAGNNTINGVITLAAGFGDSTITSNAGTLTLAGNVQPNTTSRNLHLAGAADGTVTGIIRNGSTTNVLVSVIKEGAGTWTLAAANTWTGTTVVNGGTLKLGIDAAIPTTSAVTVNGPGTLDLNGHALTVPSIAGATATGHIVASAAITTTANTSTAFAGTLDGPGSLTKNGTGTLTLSGTVDLPTVTVGGGKILLSGSGRVGTLGGLGTAKFDLGNANSRLVLTGMPLTNVVTALASAQGASKNWSGNGITTSLTQTPNANKAIGIAYGSSADFGGVTSWGSITALTGSEILLKPAYYGDLNNNGRVDLDDYTLMDLKTAKGASLAATWFAGDFDYNGTHGDASDYALMDTAYILQNGSALDPSILAQREAQFGPEYVQGLLAAVPEPTSLGLIAAGTIGLLSRRRRTSR